jgi:hypothetical protein
MGIVKKAKELAKTGIRRARINADGIIGSIQEKAGNKYMQSAVNKTGQNFSERQLGPAGKTWGGMTYDDRVKKTQREMLEKVQKDRTDRVKRMTNY